MSHLSIGLVTSPSEESTQLIKLLESLGVIVIYHISPDEIQNIHIENDALNVWLLNIDDDHWHDNIDQLLDESDASIYFNEPGTLSKQTHPDYWCQNLVSRLYELTGLTEKPTPNSEVLEQSNIDDPLPQAEVKQGQANQSVNLEPAVDELSSALDELELSSIGLPSDIAADLVSELESISPALDTSIEESLTLEAEFSLEDDFNLEENVSDQDPILLDESFLLEQEDIQQEDIFDSNSLESIELEAMELETMELSNDSLDDLDFSESDIPELRVEQGSSAIEENNPTLEPEIGGLALESVEEISNTGKAVFMEEDLEEQDEPQQEALSSLEESGLTLEQTTTSLVKGKATYVIDDQPNESELADSSQQVAKKPTVERVVKSDELPLAETGGLELEPITTGAEADWLNDEALEEGLSKAPEELQNLSSEKLEEDNLLADEFLELKDDSFELDEDSLGSETIQITPGVESADTEIVDTELTDIELVEDEPQIFEIPMLDEAATGLDFEEVIHQPTNELTPCWVVGASLGGPAAVKRFFQSLPADINACFIVAQHIDENFLPVLADILSSNSHFDVQVAKGSNVISAGKVYLAPLKGKLIFLKDGSMMVDHSQKWSEPYMPCIDDVIESLAAAYGKQSGAIIFSGMGQDGLNGVKKMLAQEGQVWAQSVETCANSSMPEAIIKAGLASVVAAPELLADRLVSYFKR